MLVQHASTELLPDEDDKPDSALEIIAGLIKRVCDSRLGGSPGPASQSVAPFRNTGSQPHNSASSLAVLEGNVLPSMIRIPQPGSLNPQPKLQNLLSLLHVASPLSAITSRDLLLSEQHLTTYNHVPAVS